MFILRTIHILIAKKWPDVALSNVPNLVFSDRLPSRAKQLQAATVVSL